MPQRSRISWSIEALNDFEDYVDWYLQNASVEGASKFVQVVEDCINAIVEN